jgi:hypothetical protein
MMHSHFLPKSQRKLERRKREGKEKKIHVVQLELAFSGELVLLTTIIVIN